MLVLLVLRLSLPFVVVVEARDEEEDAEDEWVGFLVACVAGGVLSLEGCCVEASVSVDEESSSEQEEMEEGDETGIMTFFFAMSPEVAAAEEQEGEEEDEKEEEKKRNLDKWNERKDLIEILQKEFQEEEKGYYMRIHLSLDHIHIIELSDDLLLDME